MRLALCMAGDNDIAKAFWKQTIVNMGLEDRTDIVLQINAVRGRNKDNINNFPEDHEGQELTPVEMEMHERAISRHRWTWMPKTPRFQFLDYEPYRYDENGNKTDNWMLNKLRGGYDENDYRFIDAQLKGIRRHSAVPLSVYTLPRITKGPTTEKDELHAKTAKPIVDNMDWTWLNVYPTGNDEVDDVDAGNVEWHQDRIASGLDLLDNYDKPVIPFIDPSYGMSPVESYRFNGPMISAIHTLGAPKNIKHLGVWVDVNNETVAMKQATNLVKCKEQLLRAVGV